MVRDIRRVWHPWDLWEDYKYNFYGSKPKGMKKEDCEEMYRKFLSNTEHFAEVLDKLIVEWKYSCEHHLTNITMNRIAWLGQAALAYEYKIPSDMRGGFNLLTEEQQHEANLVAFMYLNKWLSINNYKTIDSIEDCKGIGQSKF